MNKAITAFLFLMVVSGVFGLADGVEGRCTPEQITNESCYELEPAIKATTIPEN